MRAHFRQLLRCQGQQLTRAAARFMPAFEHFVHHSALPRGSRIGIERIEQAQPQDRAGVELIGIAAQPVDRGHRQRHIALRRRWARFGLRIVRCRRGLIDAPRQFGRAGLAVVFGQFAQHRLNPQHEAAGDHRAAFVALRPAEHHFGRAQRSRQIMRGKADAELRPRHAQRTQHGGRQQRIGRRISGPSPLSQPAADHQIGAAHPRFEQAVDRQARMPAPRWAHRHPVTRIAQHTGQIGRGKPGADRARSFTQFVHQRRQGAAVRLAPQRRAAQRFDSPRQISQRLFERQFIGPPQQRREHSLDALPPREHRLTPALDHRAQRREPRRTARTAQRKVKRASMIEPVGPARARMDQRMHQQREQRHRRGVARHHLRQQQQHAACGSLRQRTPSAVIGLDTPAAQLRDHPSRKAPVRRDQGGAAFGHFQRLAQQDRNRLRLIARMRAFHQPHGRQTPLRCRQIDPAGARGRRQKQVGDRAAAFGRRGA